VKKNHLAILEEFEQYRLIIKWIEFQILPTPCPSREGILTERQYKQNIII
jgi:hypothetical protein